MTTYRVLLADDHGLLRAGLRRLVERKLSHQVVGEASDGAATLVEVERTTPDIVLLDLKMPGTEPCDVIENIRLKHPHVRVLVVTGACSAEVLRRVMMAGASGVVLKPSGIERLAEAMERAMQGRLYLDPDLYLDAPDVETLLTAHERKILALLARGASYRDVGRELHIGERTIETHRRRIADKLGLRTRADLVRYALENGLLALDQGVSP